MTRRALSRLPAAQDGATIIEFAIVAPVLMVMLMGTFDIGQMAYGKAILNGAVEAAARSSAMEGSDTTAVDNIVKSAIKPILPNATVTTTRKSYFDFGDVKRPEKFTDTNNDGTCNGGEPYVDENRSGSWEADVGIAGNGGANDVVLYTVTVTYQPIFAVKMMSNYNTTRTLTAVGVRKNQPFSTQKIYGSSAGTCT